MSTAKRLVLSLRGRAGGGGGSVPGGVSASSSTRLVGHSGSSHPEHELDEIAVVSHQAEPHHVKYGSGPSLLNGPRLVPGIITSAGRGSGDAGYPGSASSSSAAAASASSQARHRSGSIPRRAGSRHSLLELVGCRLGAARLAAQPHDLSSSRDSLTASRTSAASELDLRSKARRRELRGRLKLPPNVSQLHVAAPAGAGSTPNPGPRAAPLGYEPTGRCGHNPGCVPPAPVTAVPSTPGSVCGAGGFPSPRPPPYPKLKVGRANWSFVFDPAGRLCYYWSIFVSLAFVYNFWVVIYRFAFKEIDGDTIVIWFALDYLADLIYVVDIAFHFRTGYLEDGVLQTDSTKLRQHYMNSTTFYIDCLCLLPLDFLYLSIGFNSILRAFRLVKIYRFWAFMDRTERHTNYPNLFRGTSLIHYLLVIFHWNGCLYHIIYKNNGFGSRNWVYGEADEKDVVKQYLQSYYWCTLALTTIGDLPRPRSKGEFVFVIVQLLFGLLLFATVLGHVANIVTSVSAARKEFQAKLDGVKTYMRMRRVPNHLQVKVIKWFDYLWLTQKCSDEEKAVSCLPDKLKAEIAINVHLDTLKRVEIFQNTEAGFLCELVLRLRPVLFSPGDYICRKGEVGKEMYIVNRGRLQVVGDNGRVVLATLKAGSYFGEISILNMGTAGRTLGNRRTASVRSVGYSDLFVLSKKDMWDVLKEYPAARVRLEAIAVKRLEKYKRAPLEKAAMGRSQSTPGLIESKGRVTLEDMWISPLGPLEAPLFSSTSLYTPTLSPTCRRGTRGLDSPTSATSSGRSSDEDRRAGISTIGVGGINTKPCPLHAVPGRSGRSSRSEGGGPSGGMGVVSSSSVGHSHLTGSSTQQLLETTPLVTSCASEHSSPSPMSTDIPATRVAGSLLPSTSMGELACAPSSGGPEATGTSPTSSLILAVAGIGTPVPEIGLCFNSGDETLSHEGLLAEVKRLRERLVTVEAENAQLSAKLSRQQWEVEHRLAEIEMHICGASGGSSGEENELNRESFI